MNTFLRSFVSKGKPRISRWILASVLLLIPLIAIGRQREYSHGEEFAGLIDEIAFAPDGSLAATESVLQPSTYGTQLRLHFDALNRDAILDVPGSVGPLKALRFSPDGKTLLSHGNLGVSRISVEKQQIDSWISPGNAAGEMLSFAWRDNGVVSFFLVRGKRQLGETVSIVESRRHQQNAKLLRSHTIFERRQNDAMLADCALSADARVLAAVWNSAAWSRGSISIGGGGFIELWDVDKGKLCCRLENVQPNGLGRLVFSRDNALVAAADENGRGFLWETQSGALVQMISGLRSLDDTTGVSGSFSSAAAGFGLGRATQLAFSLDSRTLFAGLSDGRVIVFDVKSGLPTALLAKVEGVVTGLLVSPSGSVLAVSSRHLNQTFSTLTRLRLAK